MTREEKIQEAAEHYEQVDATNLACDYGWGDCDIQQQCFKAGVEWADQHPRKGLVDIEKVIEYMKKNSRFDYLLETDWEILDDLRKAMED